MPEPINIFFAYARADQALRDELDMHLAFLRRSTLIEGWYDGDISVGEDWQQAIHQHLHTADIILLLVSPNFIASDYCYDVEMKKAMARHEAGEAVVIPVILRPCRWQRTPFAKFQALPKDARPITLWPNRDQAFDSAVEAIDLIARQVYAERNAPLSSKSSSSIIESFTQTAPITAPTLSSPDIVQTEGDRTKAEPEKKTEPLSKVYSEEKAIELFRSLLLKSKLVSLGFTVVIFFLCLVGLITSNLFSGRDEPSSISTITDEPDAVVVTDVTLLAPSLTNTPISMPQTITDTNNSPMVLIPAGPFEMGSEDGENDEEPVHAVTLDDFYIDQYEITNTQFTTFLNDQGNQTEQSVTWLDAGDEQVRIRQVEGVWRVDDDYGDHPVTEVTWYGANAYCEWRSARLPTEAEWEKAARGTDGRIYPWGKQTPNDQLLNFLSNVGHTAPVGSYPDGASPYGIHDMVGNVWEWVADWYSSDYYSSSSDTNPTGPTSGSKRVVRGGGWNYPVKDLRAGNRSRIDPNDSINYIGFRCARSP